MNKKNFLCVRFMEDDYGSNVYAGLEKSVRFKVSALERFCYKGFLRNSSGTKFFVHLREVSALEDVLFREVPLYFRNLNEKNINDNKTFLKTIKPFLSDEVRDQQTK